MPSGHAVKPGRHHHDLERQDGRGQQHRRRGPPDPRRRARLRGRRGRRADHRPRDADRRDHHRARLAPTRACSPTTTSSPSAIADAASEHRRARLADAAAPRLQGADARQGRRPRRTPRRRARHRPRTRPPSSRSSSTASRGRTSTSPARPGTRTTATTSARARAAGACGCWSSSRASQALAGDAVDFDLTARAEADPVDGARLRAPGDRAGRRGARPRAPLPLRDRREARRARADGHPVPGGVRRRRRRHALLRARDRGAGADRRVGLHHRRRSHLARHDGRSTSGERTSRSSDWLPGAVQRAASSPPSG